MFLDQYLNYCRKNDMYVSIFISILYPTDKCSLLKCQNGGTCDIRSGKAVCICQDNYVGKNCEKSK